MIRAALITVCLLLSGCAMFSRSPKIKVPGVEVTAPKDNGRPATLATNAVGTSVALPEGSVVTVTKIDAVPSKPAENGLPAVKGEPAREVTVIVPKGATEYVKTENSVSANSGTVDTSLAAKRIDAEESRPLLYAAIVAALAAGVFVYIHYPTPAICCGVASVVFFLAWKVSGLPSWFYVIGLCACAGGAMMYFGHNRGLYTPVPTDKNPTQ